MAATEELSAPDGRPLRFRLKGPFPHLPEAVAGAGGPVPVIMPERLASSSPAQPVKELVGSGPYRSLADEHVSGARAVFARFAEYRPRDAGGSGGALGFTSGPKTVHFDRVEWLTLDAFSAQAALSRGEIDWWESPPRDLANQIARDRNVTLVSHYMPAMGILRFNQLYPPFDKPEARRALLAAIHQAQAPTDKSGWNVFFTMIDRSIPNTNPFGNQALRADGKAAWDGWPDSPKIEALRAAWLDAADVNEQRRICSEMQTQLWHDLPFIP